MIAPIGLQFVFRSLLTSYERGVGRKVSLLEDGETFGAERAG